MTTSLYKQLALAWRKPKESYVKALMRERVVAWRKQPTILRAERPTKLHRARMLGFKAKPGFVIVRVKVRRGPGEKTRPSSGRRPKALGFKRLTRVKSKQLIAEERAAKRFPNLKVLGSYYVWEDGTHRWIEVVMADPEFIHK